MSLANYMLSGLGSCTWLLLFNVVSLTVLLLCFGVLKVQKHPPNSLFTTAPCTPPQQAKKSCALTGLLGLVMDVTGQGQWRGLPKAHLGTKHISIVAEFIQN